MSGDTVHFDIQAGCFFGDFATVGNKLWPFVGPILDAFEEFGVSNPEISLGYLFHFARRGPEWRFYLTAEGGCCPYPEVWH